MATEKKITSRIQQKHDVAANWAKATNFIPKKGEIIIYDAEYNTSGVETTPVRFKIGNGSATVNALPFVKTDNGVKLGGGTVPSGLTGTTADSCIDQVYANILDDGSQRNYFPQLMSRIESGQLLLLGIDLSTEMALYIMHITGVIENEVTASQGTPVEGSNAGVYHFIIAEKSAESGSEKFLLWAEKTGSAFSKYRSSSTGSTETFSAYVTAGWNSNYVNTTTGLCNFNSLVSGGNFTWVLMSTVMAGQDAGATPTGNYFFAGSPFTIEYEAQVGQMAVLDRQFSGGYRKGYYIGSYNLESSNSTWQNYQAGTDIGSSIVFNTALKNSTIGACLSNICSLSPSGNCIVRTYRDDVATYKVVPILSDGVDGNGEWTLYAGAMLVGSAGSYYGLFEASHPLTMRDPFGDAAESIYDWNQWVNLSSTGAWTTNAGSRKAKYVNFEALSLLYQYAMFGEYNIVKLPLRKVAEAQGSYAKVLAEAVQDKQDKLSDGQITAANSGVTAAKVAKYDGYENIINGKQDKITSANKLDSNLIKGLGAAAAKAVDTAITANSTSTNLPTSKAVEDRINAHSGIDKVGTVTGVKMNGTTKTPSSGVVDIGTVLTDASKFATSAQGTKADNAMPKAGGAFTGAVTVQAPTAEMNPATKQYVDTAINAVKQFEYQVITELPTAAQATMGKIYLVAHSHNPSDGKPDSYDEFITVQSGSTYKWERIGNTDIDLSGYVPTTRKINNKALSSDITLYPTDVGVNETTFPGLKKTGTVTGVKMNGTTKNPSSGVVDLGTVITAHQSLDGKQDKITSSNKLSASLVSGLATVATSGSYNDLSNKPTIPTVNNGKLTIQKNGTDVATFTANQSTNVTANITVPTKVSEITNDSGYTTNKGTVTSVSVKMNGASKGTVTSSGTIDLGTVITSHQNISGKLDKTAYEVNKTIDFGSSGALYVGKFKVYDTNVTCEVTSTTNVTYSGKLVIATQNYVIAQMTVYGDAANTVAPNFFVKPSTTSNPYIEVYFKPSSWSKNVVHIYGSNIQAEPTNVCTNVPSVPSTATLKPKNALPTYTLSGTTLTITL